MKKFLLFFIYPLLYFSCQEPADESTQQHAKMPLVIEPMITITPVIQQTSNINFTSATQKIFVRTGKPKEITGSKGLRILIDTTALETENGMPIGSEIEVGIKEITDQEALFKNDAPTVSSGKLLISGGSYYIEMASDGNKLKIKEGRSIQINVPSNSAGEMELFYGQKDAAGILNWEPAGEKMNAKKTVAKIHRLVLKTRAADEITAATADSAMAVTAFQTMVDTAARMINDQPTQNDYYYPAAVRRLGWINCDKFYKSQNKCDIQVTNDAVLKPSAAAVYIVFKTINGMQKEYISFSNNSFSTKLNNDYPVGLPVKLIAITNVDGKFYTCRQEFVLAKKEMIQLKFDPVADINAVRNSYGN